MGTKTNPRLLVKEIEDDCGNKFIEVIYDAEKPMGGLPTKMSLKLPLVLWEEVIPVVESLLSEDEEEV